MSAIVSCTYSALRLISCRNTSEVVKTTPPLSGPDNPESFRIAIPSRLKRGIKRHAIGSGGHQLFKMVDVKDRTQPQQRQPEERKRPISMSFTHEGHEKHYTHPHYYTEVPKYYTTKAPETTQLRMLPQPTTSRLQLITQPKLSNSTLERPSTTEISRVSFSDTQHGSPEVSNKVRFKQ
ncbi:hypothetical protein DAPPUDRAFT_239248 [Daphnia pulex]|uniref:Uncharacterized protein n=1 Tax=Daphnia pulex TaxID=6669 RepID=E9G8R5_DAPPU|nr:hypothetical protein DAPPUDRAFT_239248 [Daphnia pulex]|eukprot:EFX84223.1 hypothetical protein DAPPUDRAFT_239248 [Daphnia pulex]